MGRLRRSRRVRQPLFARRERTHGAQPERRQLYHPPLARCAAGEPNVPRLRGHSTLGAHVLLDRFSVDYHSYDLMRGYRADDSYFSFANAFLNNGLSLSRLERAMALGNLGEQVVVRSEKAFSRLVFEGFETADRTVYYPRKMARDHEARAIYREELKLADLAGDYTISDIMREDWRADDARLRRVVFE